MASPSSMATTSTNGIFPSNTSTTIIHYPPPLSSSALNGKGRRYSHSATNSPMTASTVTAFGNRQTNGKSANALKQRKPFTPATTPTKPSPIIASVPSQKLPPFSSLTDNNFLDIEGEQTRMLPDSLQKEFEMVVKQNPHFQQIAKLFQEVLSSAKTTQNNNMLLYLSTLCARLQEDVVLAYKKESSH